MNGYPCFYGYHSSIIHAFMDIHLDILGFLWFPFIDLLWIFDRGLSIPKTGVSFYRVQSTLISRFRISFFEK